LFNAAVGYEVHEGEGERPVEICGRAGDCRRGGAEEGNGRKEQGIRPEGRGGLQQGLSSLRDLATDRRTWLPVCVLRIFTDEKKLQWC